MWSKLLQQIRALFRRSPSEFNYKPVTHRLNSKPTLPKGMMEDIAPAYQEVLAKEKEEKEEKSPPEAQE